VERYNTEKVPVFPYFAPMGWADRPCRRPHACCGAVSLLLLCAAARWRAGVASATMPVCRIMERARTQHRGPLTAGGHTPCAHCATSSSAADRRPPVLPWRLRGGFNDDSDSSSKLGGDPAFDEHVRISAERADQQYHDLVATRARLINEVRTSTCAPRRLCAWRSMHAVRVVREGHSRRLRVAASVCCADWHSPRDAEHSTPLARRTMRHRAASESRKNTSGTRPSSWQKTRSSH